MSLPVHHAAKTAAVLLLAMMASACTPVFSCGSYVGLHPVTFATCDPASAPVATR